MEKQYRNQEIINYVDQLSNKIIETNQEYKTREKFFPLLVENLGLKIGVEVGVDKGDFSAAILENTSIEKMYCVDPWINDFGSDHRPGYFDKSGEVRMKQAYEKLKPFIENGRAELVRATGLESGKFLPNDCQYIFIDGDHSLSGIYDDIYTWTPKVQIGGIISGHDFKNGPNSGMKDYWGNQMDFAVKYVVEYYCNRYGYKLNTVGGKVPCWWFVKI